MKETKGEANLKIINKLMCDEIEKNIKINMVPP